MAHVLYLTQCTRCIFCAEEEYHTLLRKSSKNQLHEALANGRFEDASHLIATQSEAYLVECFEGREGCLKSCLHIIAAISNTEDATKLSRQLMQRIKNLLNRDYILSMRTVDEFDMGGWKVHARVAAIHIAAYSGNAGVVRLLCQEYGVDVNCSSSETLKEVPWKGITPLEWAARKGHKDVVTVLLENNADVNASRPTDGVTALFIAAQEGHAEVVEMLLANKAEVNASRTDGTTALYMATRRGYAEIVKLLLDNNADVDTMRTDDGTTALYAATCDGHAEVVKLLLASDADVNARVARDGSTPLHDAAWKGNAELVKLLLNNNADVNARRHNGTTALDLAKRNGHAEVVKLLLENNADVNASTETFSDLPAAEERHAE